MPDYGDCRSTTIKASPEACFDAITDYEALPSWQGAVRSARVIGHNLVEFEVDARIKTVRYRLRQVPERPHRLGCEYAGGDFRDFSGEWRFIAVPEGTRVELELRIDPGRLVPGPVRAAIANAVMSRALSDLKRHLER